MNHKDLYIELNKQGLEVQPISSERTGIFQKGVQKATITNDLESKVLILHPSIQPKIEEAYNRLPLELRQGIDLVAVYPQGSQVQRQMGLEDLRFLLDYIIVRGKSMVDDVKTTYLDLTRAANRYSLKLMQNISIL